MITIKHDIIRKNFDFVCCIGKKYQVLSIPEEYLGKIASKRLKMMTST